jgi:ribosome-associated translation inhibitor RaiA
MVMPIPLKVVDRAGLLTGSLAEHVRERTQKLSQHYGRIRQCRVTVDGPGQHALRGRVRVSIYLSVPGAEIAINRLAAEDLPIAIRESFDAAARRMEDHVRLKKQSLKNSKRRPRRGA